MPACARRSRAEAGATMRLVIFFFCALERGCKLFLRTREGMQGRGEEFKQDGQLQAVETDDFLASRLRILSSELAKTRVPFDRGDVAVLKLPTVQEPEMLAAHARSAGLQAMVKEWAGSGKLSMNTMVSDSSNLLHISPPRSSAPRVASVSQTMSFSASGASREGLRHVTRVADSNIASSRPALERVISPGVRHTAKRPMSAHARYQTSARHQGLMHCARISFTGVALSAKAHRDEAVTDAESADRQVKRYTGQALHMDPSCSLPVARSRPASAPPSRPVTIIEKRPIDRRAETKCWVLREVGDDSDQESAETREGPLVAMGSAFRWKKPSLARWSETWREKAGGGSAVPTFGMYSVPRRAKVTAIPELAQTDHYHRVLKSFSSQSPRLVRVNVRKPVRLYSAPKVQQKIDSCKQPGPESTKWKATTMIDANRGRLTVPWCWRNVSAVPIGVPQPRTQRVTAPGAGGLGAAGGASAPSMLERLAAAKPSE